MSQAARTPVLPASAPFAPEQIQLLNTVFPETSPEQRSWLAGFLAGYQAATTAVPANLPQPAPAPQTAPKRPLTILYGTESGNAESLADDAKKAAAKLGFTAKLVDMADTTPAEIAKSENLLVVASTWGEGDPPQRAEAFYRALLADDAPGFESTRFAVLALGDTSYVNFCATGRIFDERLAALGATRVTDRVECDLDFEAPAADWTQATLARLDKMTRPAEPAAGAAVIHVDFHAAASGGWSKTNPFEAEITEAINLNGSRSDKETLHVELSLEGSGLTYEPGDAIGIAPENDPAVVEAVLRTAGLDGDATADGRPLAEALTDTYDVTTLSRRLAERYAELTDDTALRTLAAASEFDVWAEGRQLIDLLEAHRHTLSAAQLTGLLRKLPPRLYSIASSLKAVPDAAHLLLGAVRYSSHNRVRTGVASGFVADRRRAGDRLKIHVKPNKAFRLPADPGRPLVMIGAGTGVAPYRAFMQEREALGACGRNWLVFGDRRYTHDFLYQTEWQDWRKAGLLHRIDVAFSRDQPEKVYVQDRLRAQGRELVRWLNDGAHIYVCGALAMGRDVDLALRDVLVAEAGLSADAAAARLQALAAEGRYARDVY
jgi:sulfite reductase (NADPH) flavoprotein alpha-component